MELHTLSLLHSSLLTAPHTRICITAYNHAARQVSEHTTNLQKMDEFSMVYYNNLLSLPCILGLALVFGELEGFTAQPALRNPQFLLVAGAGGVIGFAISFSSLWFLSQVCGRVYRQYIYFFV